MNVKLENASKRNKICFNKLQRVHVAIKVFSTFLHPSSNRSYKLKLMFDARIIILKLVRLLATDKWNGEVRLKELLYVT